MAGSVIHPARPPRITPQMPNLPCRNQSAPAAASVSMPQRSRVSKRFRPRRGQSRSDRIGVDRFLHIIGLVQSCASIGTTSFGRLMVADGALDMLCHAAIGTQRVPHRWTGSVPHRWSSVRLSASVDHHLDQRWGTHSFVQDRSCLNPKAIRPPPVSGVGIDGISLRFDPAKSAALAHEPSRRLQPARFFEC